MKRICELRQMVMILIILMLITGLSACGNKETDTYEEPINNEVEQTEDSQDISIEEEETTTSDTIETQITEDVETKTVDIIDMRTTVKGSGEYKDANEGYNRGFSFTSNQAIKLVDYKLFKSNKSDSKEGLIVMHFVRTMDNKFKDANDKDADQLREIISVIDAFDMGFSKHTVNNIDTGAEENLEDIGGRIYPSEYEGFTGWLSEVGAWDEERDRLADSPTCYIYPLTVIDCVAYQDQFERAGNNTIDFYYAAKVDRIKGTLEFYCRNTALDTNYFYINYYQTADYTVEYYNDKKQLLTINLD